MRWSTKNLSSIIYRNIWSISDIKRAIFNRSYHCCSSLQFGAGQFRRLQTDALQVQTGSPLCLSLLQTAEEGAERRREGWWVSSLKALTELLASTSKIMREHSVSNESSGWVFLHKPKHNMQLTLFIYLIPISIKDYEPGPCLILSLNNFKLVEKIFFLQMW